MRLTGKIPLITWAGPGIGLMIAQAFDPEAGHDVTGSVFTIDGGLLATSAARPSL